jgi:hypothetical protein
MIVNKLYQFATHSGDEQTQNYKVRSPIEVSGQPHAPATLPASKSPHGLLNRRMGESQCWFGGLGGENKLPLPGSEPRIIQPINKSLHQLKYPDSFTI